MVVVLSKDPENHAPGKARRRANRACRAHRTHDLLVKRERCRLAGREFTGTRDQMLEGGRAMSMLGRKYLPNSDKGHVYLVVHVEKR